MPLGKNHIFYNTLFTLCHKINWQYNQQSTRGCQTTTLYFILPNYFVLFDYLKGNYSE